MKNESAGKPKREHGFFKGNCEYFYQGAGFLTGLALIFYVFSGGNCKAGLVEDVVCRTVRPASDCPAAKTLPAASKPASKDAAGPVRFALLCCGRSGSNVLRTMMQAHDGVVMLGNGEIFQSTYKWDKQPNLFNAIKGKEDKRWNDKIARKLLTSLWKQADKNTKAIGFKQKICQEAPPPRLELDKISRLIVQDPTIKLVVLIRENTIDRAISTIRGAQDGWTNKQYNGKAKLNATQVAHKAMQQWRSYDFLRKEIEKYDAWGRTTFVSYSALADTHYAPFVMANVFGHLGLKAPSAGKMFKNSVKLQSGQHERQSDKVEDYKKFAADVAQKHPELEHYLTCNPNA